MWSPARATVTSSSRARSRSAACAPADYSLPGVFPARKQASAHTGWITQITVLLSWRDDKPYTEDEVLALLGPSWIARRKERSSLSDDETAVLLGTLGLCTPPPQLLSSEAWEALLRLYGPVAIIDGDAGSVRLPTSGRIVFGVRGDGTMNGTRVTFVDTESGDVGDITLEKLGGPYRLVHWHADAGLASGVKPTAPAPKHIADAAAPRPNGRAAVTASSRRWAARQASTPAWDRPENFPREIRAFWAQLDSRLHHFIWHEARATWPNLDPPIRRAFDRLAFTPPPRLVGAAGSGVDFLNMHRQMVSATRAVAISAGVDYRPLGWNPIPWEHADPVWPMPAWPGERPRFKTPEITAYWKKQVAEKLASDEWLAGVSLDALGQEIESGIHNWMHMHWASPRPSNADDLRSADPSNDWLGSTFTSQVNPAFWKLHGWIDECIERWESAPATLGRPRRSAADDLRRFNWNGPVPKPPTPSAKSTAGHAHEGDISEAELQELVAGIDFTARPSFPFASLSRRELVARFGDVGEITVAELQEIEPATSRMASVDGRRRIVVGHERHGMRRGTRAMAGPAAVVGPIIAEKGIEWLIGELTSRADGSRFVVNSEDVTFVGLREYRLNQWTRTIADITLLAQLAAPSFIPVPLPKLPKAPFTLRVDFEHNENNIRAVKIGPVKQASTALKKGGFTITLLPSKTPDESEQTRLPYAVDGQWDPGYGDKQYNFTGRLVLTGAGTIDFSLDPIAEDMVTYDRTKHLRVVKREAVPTPSRVRIGPREPLLFGVDSWKIDDSERQKLVDWHADLKKPENKVRYGRLKDGAIVIHVEGYASDTATADHNQTLSKRRAEGVKAILQGWLGPNAQIHATGEGERNPGEKLPKEDPAARRVDVYFEVF